MGSQKLVPVLGWLLVGLETDLALPENVGPPFSGVSCLGLLQLDHKLLRVLGLPDEGVTPSHGSASYK